VRIISLIAFAIVSQVFSVSAEEVDLRLVFATDVSESISIKSYKTQRDGLVTALRDPSVQLQLASAGPIGKVAVTYVEWSGHRVSNRIRVPWMVLRQSAMADDVEKFVAELLVSTEKLVPGLMTGIGIALQFVRVDVLGKSPYTSTRTVIDISGDQPNNAGPAPDNERDLLTANGDVTINGIVLVSIDPSTADHYEEHVIGGPRSFVLKVESIEDYERTMRRKLLTEIAWR